MLTRCTHCDTWFRVEPADLRPARGHVRCNQCMQPFDALEHLTEEPAASRPDVAAPGAQPDTAEAPSRADRPEGEAPALAAAPEVAADAEHTSEPVPEVLREDLARLDALNAARRWRLFFAVASGLLLALLATQYAWFNPARLLDQFPQSRPWLETLCRHSGCVLPERRDTARIQITSRDVRAHPRYEGALLVNATLMNVAPYRQPFPRMRFTLFNVNGQTIASRVFTPDQYLSGDDGEGREMSPREPVQVALDLLAPDQVAVSFEFQFL